LAAGGFAFVTAERVVPVVVAAGEPEFVRLAAEDLASDVAKITGRRPEVMIGGGDAAAPGEPCVVIATVGRDFKIPSHDAGGWESYRVEAEDGRLVIEGGDARGTMFGVYVFIEKYLKVDPLYFWSGLEPEKRTELKWAGVSLREGPPSFKFRGWFINDEDLLTEWMESGGKRNIDYPFYGQIVHVKAMEAVAEALVRSRFNLIIPASFIDILNPPEAALVEACARRGVFVSQHHVEPMGVSAFSYFNYWKARGKDLKYSYFSHPAEVREVWRAYAQAWAKVPNVIWQLGLRGVADRPMWQADPDVPQSDADRGRIISEAMAEQVKILDEVCPGRPLLKSTTLWAEGSVLNQKGHLKIPEGTIIVFADNSPGWRWPRDFHETPRDPKNAYGVYYHHALIGSGPHLAQVVPPHKTFELMRQAREKGAGEYAIFNVSNIREFVLGIGATAEMTWRMEGYDPDAWLEAWVGERFSAKRAEIADAYRIYFNAWQIHDRQRVPFLMDGQMFAAGGKILTEMGKKLKAGKIGGGVAREAIAVEAGNVVGRDFKIPSHGGADAFYEGLSDMHPKPLARRETVKRLAAQQAGFELAALHARAAAGHHTSRGVVWAGRDAHTSGGVGMAGGEDGSHTSGGVSVAEGQTRAGSGGLDGAERAFLDANLIYPADIMRQTCAWLRALLTAQEALDLGDVPACARALAEAEEAFAEIPERAAGYCSGKWETWYRGCKKLNVAARLQQTRDVLKMAVGSGSRQ
jgi:hypothetical protein